RPWRACRVEGEAPGPGLVPDDHSPHSTPQGTCLQAARSRRQVKPDLTRCPVAVPPDHPLLIVTPPKLLQGLDQLGDRGEVPDPEDVLLEGSDKTFGDAVALRLPDEARRAGHAEERQLLLKVVTHGGTAVVVADGQPGGDPLVEAAEVLAHALAERLQRLEAVARFRGMQADALPGAVIDGDEDVDLALLGGHGRGRVRAPHLVGSLSDDRPVVGLRAMGLADAIRGLEAVLAHQPAHPLLGSPDALVAEPGPDLAVAFAVERRLGQDAANIADQLLIRTGAERTSLPGLR